MARLMTAPNRVISGMAVRHLHIFLGKQVQEASGVKLGRSKSTDQTPQKEGHTRLAERVCQALGVAELASIPTIVHARLKGGNAPTVPLVSLAACPMGDGRDVELQSHQQDLRTSAFRQYSCMTPWRFCRRAAKGRARFLSAACAAPSVGWNMDHQSLNSESTPGLGRRATRPLRFHSQPRLLQCARCGGTPRASGRDFALQGPRSTTLPSSSDRRWTGRSTEAKKGLVLGQVDVRSVAVLQNCTRRWRGLGTIPALVHVHVPHDWTLANSLASDHCLTYRAGVPATISPPPPPWYSTVHGTRRL